MLDFAINAVIFAHQGGWDEILMIGAPIAVFAFLLRAANRRANNMNDEDGTVFRPDDKSPSSHPKGPM